MELRHKYEVGVGLLFLLGIITLGYMAIRIGGTHRFGPQETYYIEVKDATGLVENGAVLVSGVEVGYVKDISVEPVTHKAQVQIQVRSDLDVKEDAHAVIRAKSLLGEKFLDLYPGSPAADDLPPGAVIRRSNSLVGIDQFVEELRTDIIGKVDPELVNGLLEIAYNSLKGHEQDIGDTIRSVRNIFVKIDNEMNSPDGDLDKLFTGMGNLAAAIGSLSREDRREIVAAVRNMAALAAWAVDSTPKIDRNFERLDRLAELPQLSPENIAQLASATESLLHQSNDFLVRFSGVDFEDIKRMLQDEGITFSLTSRSDDLRRADSRFDTAPDE